MELVPRTLETSKEAKQWNRHMKWGNRFDSEEGTMSKAKSCEQRFEELSGEV
jgi:hypothetical protein